MKKFRNDYFINGEHLKRYFDTLEQAEKAAHEAKRDGARAYLLELLESIQKYEVIKEW